MELSVEATLALQGFLVDNKESVFGTYSGYNRLRPVYDECFPNKKAATGYQDFSIEENRAALIGKSEFVTPKDTEVVDLLREIRDLLKPEIINKQALPCTCGSYERNIYKEIDGTGEVRVTTRCSDCQNILEINTTQP